MNDIGLKCVLISGFVLFLGNALNAQEFIVDGVNMADVPACSSEVEHTIEITNQFGTQVTGTGITLTFPPELSFVNLNSGPLLLDEVSGNEVSFSVPGFVEDGAVLAFSYSVSATCAQALPTSILVEVECDQTTDISTQGTQELGFNFRAPSVLIMDVGNDLVDVLPGTSYNRPITLRNAGNQPVEEVRVALDYANGFVEVISLSDGTLEGDEVVLNSTDFPNGALLPEEDFVLTLTEQLIHCNGQPVSYTASWSCGDETCQSSVGTADTNPPPGEPNVSFQATSATDPQSCEVPGQSSFILTNTAIEAFTGAASAHDVKLSFGFTWPENGNINTAKYSGEFFIVTSILVGDDEYNLDAPIIDPALSNTAAIYQVVLDTLPASSSLPVVVNWYYHPPNTDALACEDLQDVTFHGKLNGQVNYTNKCGQAKPRVFAEGSGSLFQYRLIDEAILAPTDAIEGEAFTFAVMEHFRIEGPYCDSPTYRLRLSVPAGYVPDPSTVYALYNDDPLSVNWSFSAPGVIDLDVDLGNGSAIPLYGEVEAGMDFLLDCSSEVVAGIDYSAYLVCDDCNSDEYISQLACGTSLKPAPDCGDCSGIRLEGFPTLYRASFGFTDESQTTEFTLAQAQAQGTASKAYVHDVVEINVPATVQGQSGISSPQLVLTHPLLGASQLLDPLEGFTATFIPDGGSAVTVALALPVVSELETLFEYRFDLSAALQSALGVGATLGENDQVSVSGQFRVTDQFPFEDKTAFLEIPELRVRYEADALLCNSRGLLLEVAHPNYVWLVDNNLTQVAGCAEFDVGFNFRNRSLNNTPHFPGEFRPMFEAHSFSLFVPEGWSIAPGSARLEYMPQDECDLASLQNQLLGNPDGIIQQANGQTLQWFNDGSWPLKDDGCVYYGTQYRFVVRLVAGCDAEVGDQLYMPAELEVTTFKYADPAFQATSTQTYQNFRPADYWSDTDFSLTTVEGISQNGSSLGEWVIRLVNETGNAEVVNTWLSFPNLLSADLELVEVLNAQTGTSLPVFSNDTTSWVFPENIPAGGYLDYRIRAEILGCADHSFVVRSGMDCAALDGGFSPDVDPCDPQQIALSYVQQPTGLQVTFNAPTAASSLCGVEFFEVDLNNALLGFASNLTLKAVLPENVVWMQDSSVFQFPGPPELTDAPGAFTYGSLLPPAYVGDTLIWSLDELLPDSLQDLGLPGAEFTESNAAHIVVGLCPECGFIQGDEVRFFVDYTSACGEAQTTIASGVQTVEIEGVNETLQTEFILDIEPLTLCSDTSVVTIRVDVLTEDLLETSSVEQTFFMQYPQELQVLGNSFTNLFNAEFLDDYVWDEDAAGDGELLTQFPLPEGMTSGDSLAFSFWVDRSSLPDGSYTFTLEGSSEIASFCDGFLCSMTRILGSVESPFEESFCSGDLPPVAVNDTLLMAPGALEDVLAGANDFDPEDAMDLSFWEIIAFPQHGDVSLIDWGFISYVADLGFTGKDSLQYRIRDQTGQLDSAWVMIQMYDPEISCDQLFVNETHSAVIENCEGVYTYCLPMLYDALAGFDLEVNGEAPDSIAACNTLFFTAYSFDDAQFQLCLPEGQFPMQVEHWYIEGTDYGPATVNSFPDLAQWMNVIDPCGFWSVDAQGRIRGGMVVLDYGDLVLTSPCENITESFAWNEYSVPQNPAVLLPPGTHDVVLHSLDLWECSDTISVTVDCLGIVNTPPYTVENGLPVDTFYAITYQDMMIDHCFSFEDNENHTVGIQEVFETDPETVVFYAPGDSCICYLPPPGFLGTDTVIAHFCDNGDPVLCGDAVLIVDVLSLDELDNTPPYTVDNQGLPEDTLWVSVPVNLATEYCLNFVDEEGHNVHVTDWVDFGTDGSATDFPTLDGCLLYTPSPGFVGSDIILVNYCDDGDPYLCNFTWVVLEIDPNIDPNDPPDVLDAEGLPTDTLYFTTFMNQPLESCLEVQDAPLQQVLMAGVLVQGQGNLYLPSEGTCFEYQPPLDFLGTDEVVVNVCDNAPNEACTQVTLIIEVLPMDCPPTFYTFNGDTLNPVLPGCEGLYSYTFPFFLTEVNVNQITVNGAPANLIVTETTPFRVFEVGATLDAECDGASVFPVEINGLNIDGSQYSGGIANSWLELLAALNALDPFLTWTMPEPGVFRIPYNPGISYGTLQLFTDCSEEPQFVVPELQDVPFQGKVELDTQDCYTIEVVAAATGCSYALTVCPQCMSNTPPYTVDSAGDLALNLNITMPVGTVVEYCFVLEDAESNNVTVTSASLSNPDAYVVWDDNTICFMYSPNAGDEELIITLDYCDDGSPVLCNTSTMTITFTGQSGENLPPEASDDNASCYVGEQVPVDVLQNDSDPDGDALEVTVNACGSGYGAFLGGMLYYQAPELFCGLDSICYTICDPAGLCDNAVVYIDVIPLDSDMDGLPDHLEGEGDADLDGLPNLLDADSDNDGISDGAEASLQNPAWNPCIDLPADSDGDGLPDFEDTDSDNDGLQDALEGTDDCDSDGTPNYLDADPCEEPANTGLVFPQGFSPNNDGAGDQWVIQGLEEVGPAELHIYNRWGHEVYATFQYQNNWDGYQELYGARKDAPLPIGTYYFVLTPSQATQSYQGWVYLTR